MYLVSRTNAQWLDRPGNVLCLCPTCAAKLQFGTVEVDGDLDALLLALDSKKSQSNLGIRLCGEARRIKFTSRHLIDMQELIKSSGSGGG